MLFVIYCVDKPGHLQTRLDNRPAHLEYLKAAGGAVKLGGPLLGADGQNPAGSLLIVEQENLAAAQKFADNDPYAKAGLFESVGIRPWRHAVGAGL